MRMVGDPVAWRDPTEIPDVKPGDTAYRIVAVKRAHSGKTYSFAAFYLNQVSLFFGDENEDRIVTGWNSDDEGDDGPVYKPLLGPNDELMGWCDFPAFAPPQATGEVRERIAQIVHIGLSIAEETDDTDPAARDYLIDAILVTIGAGRE